MIVFVLYVYLGANIIDRTQKFVDMDRCLYFAERLSKQNQPVKITLVILTHIVFVIKMPRRNLEKTHTAKHCEHVKRISRNSQKHKMNYYKAV